MTTFKFYGYFLHLFIRVYQPMGIKSLNKRISKSFSKSYHTIIGINKTEIVKFFGIGKVEVKQKEVKNLFCDSCFHGHQVGLKM